MTTVPYYHRDYLKYSKPWFFLSDASVGVILMELSLVLLYCFIISGNCVSILYRHEQLSVSTFWFWSFCPIVCKQTTLFILCWINFFYVSPANLWDVCGRTLCPCRSIKIVAFVTLVIILLAKLCLENCCISTSQCTISHQRGLQ